MSCTSTRNQLTGEIPPELGGLTNLEVAVPLQQRVDRGDTGGVGQPDQPGEGCCTSTGNELDRGRYRRSWAA